MKATAPRVGWLLVPYGLLVLALLVVPALGLLEISLRGRSTLVVTGEGFTTANYMRLVDAHYVKIVLQTIKLALLATCIEVVLAYPVAYVLARSQGIVRTVVTCVVMIPLMTSVIVKAFGWYIVLGRNGPAVNALNAIGLPIRTLLNTEASVIVGMVEFALPFMIFSLASAIERIPPRLEEAAANLGASPIVVFAKVVLPMSRTGLMSGVLLCFGVSSSAYVVPAVLGGTSTRLVAQQIYDDVLVAFNWPGAAALSTVLLGLLGAILYAALRLGRRDAP